MEVLDGGTQNRALSAYDLESQVEMCQVQAQACQLDPALFNQCIRQNSWNRTAWHTCHEKIQGRAVRLRVTVSKYLKSKKASR